MEGVAYGLEAVVVVVFADLGGDPEAVELAAEVGTGVDDREDANATGSRLCGNSICAWAERGTSALAAFPPGHPLTTREVRHHLERLRLGYGRTASFTPRARAILESCSSRPVIYCAGVTP
jgi:hypothetical protein